MLAAAGVLSCSTLAAQENAPLRPGDAIRLSSIREDQLSGTFPVDEQGVVSLPLLGSVSVKQLPAAELKPRLQKEYGKRLGEYQQVSITLLRRVRVFGAVKNPGIYQVDPTMNLADAVALAGGTTRDGSMDRVRVVRDGKSLRPDDIGSASGIDALRSGDEIVVPERPWLVRNAGAVVGASISAVAIIVSRLIS